MAHTWVHLVKAEEGDWIEAWVDGVVFAAGHSMQVREWVELLKRAGVEVTQAEVSGEEHHWGRLGEAKSGQSRRAQ